jgi:hypothetical protein
VSNKVLHNAFAIGLIGIALYLPLHIKYSREMWDVAKKYDITLTSPIGSNFMDYSIQDRTDFEYYRKMNSIYSAAGLATLLPALGIGASIARKWVRDNKEF